MQRAAAKLGLELVQLTGGANGVWGLETADGVVMDADKAEHVREAAPVLGRFADAIALRAFAQHRSLDEDRADALVRGFAQHAGVPVVNLESAQWHPCQALADWATLDMLEVPKRAKLVLTWAWHPRALRTRSRTRPSAWAPSAAWTSSCCGPRATTSDAPVLEHAHALAAASGGSVEVTDDPATRRWPARRSSTQVLGQPRRLGRPRGEAAARADLRDWCVTDAWMERTDDARFLHCLPVRRNVVVADEVLDGPRSVVRRPGREPAARPDGAARGGSSAAREATADAVHPPATPELESIR